MQKKSEWLRFPPCVPLNLLITFIQRTEGSAVADNILKNIHVKGDNNT